MPLTTVSLLPAKPLKKIFTLVLINILVLVGLFTCFELLGRGVAFLKLGPKINRYIIWDDPQLGWVLNTQFFPQVHQNRCREDVQRIPPKDPLIVRAPKASGGITVLFLGDSYTHAHEVSSGQAYYDIFEAEAAGDISVFAAGVGGYGSLQEYLALETVYNRVKPDVVIWQLSGNDVINNVYEFERAALADNSQRPRPYLDLETGLTDIKNPGYYLLQKSDLGRFIFQKSLMIDQKYGLGLFEKLKNALYPRGEQRLKLQEQGLGVLNLLLQKAMQRFPDTDFYGFSVGAKFDEEFEQIFLSNGAGYFQMFHERVKQVANTDCRPLDAHWNHLGNRVAGTELLRLFMQARTEKSP